MATSINLKPKQTVELSRFCLNPYYTHKNLAGWFLSRTVKKLKNYKALITFADPNYSHTGIIYKATNWKFLGESVSDYHYMHPDGYPLHKKTVYNRAKTIDLTEQQYVVREGLIQIKQQPKFKYVYYM